MLARHPASARLRFRNYYLEIMWSQAKLDRNQALIDQNIREGGRVTPFLMAPEFAYSQAEAVQISFLDLLNSGDPYAATFIIKAIGSKFNSPILIANQILGLLDSQLEGQVQTNELVQSEFAEIIRFIREIFETQPDWGPELLSALENLNQPREI